MVVIDEEENRLSVVPTGVTCITKFAGLLDGRVTGPVSYPWIVRNSHQLAAAAPLQILEHVKPVLQRGVVPGIPGMPLRRGGHRAQPHPGNDVGPCDPFLQGLWAEVLFRPAKSDRQWRLVPPIGGAPSEEHHTDDG